MTIWRTRIACWITKSINTLSQYAILTAFPLQQWLHERASTLRFTYISCLVSLKKKNKTVPEHQWCDILCIKYVCSVFLVREFLWGEKGYCGMNVKTARLNKAFYLKL
jgi:hypothetical protein